MQAKHTNAGAAYRSAFSLSTQNEVITMLNSTDKTWTLKSGEHETNQEKFVHVCVDIPIINQHVYAHVKWNNWLFLKTHYGNFSVCNR